MKKQKKTTKVMFDGNMSAAHIAYATNEACAIYPITPSSVMGELADEWSSKGKKNIWGHVPEVSEMQSEAGAAGAVHGALTCGVLATTFTASQGLHLMTPNMYKIAGELAPVVIYVSARSMACQALSIFGDHSDIMGIRETGFAILASNNPQEVMDCALAAQSCTLKSRIPFTLFFDGFRTSHEIQKVELIEQETIRAMIDEDKVLEVRDRALRPEAPSMRGTAQNPDLYFQGREAVNKFYNACPEIMEDCFAQIKKETGREYGLFEYEGHPKAESIIIIMGSGAETVLETVEFLNKNKNSKVGLLRVRLFRPWSSKHFLKVIPKSVKNIIVLDRTKEPGSIGEPLYLDVVATLNQPNQDSKFKPRILGGRYGLSSKEFTPNMVLACFKHAESPDAFHGFTVGINDDVTHLSLDCPEELETEDPSCYRAKFYGLGSDGTVGASKNNIKVVGENTEKFAQGYFVYDSKKAGSLTCSHLRFSDVPIKSTYLIARPDFVAIHAESFIGIVDMLRGIKENGHLLINSYTAPDQLFDNLPRSMQETILNKKLKVSCINAYDIVQNLGLPGRINTTMQGAFFKLSHVLEESVYRSAIETAIINTFESKGSEVVRINVEAFKAGIEKVRSVVIPNEIIISGPEHVRSQEVENPQIINFVEEVIDAVGTQNGDLVKVSQIPCDGAFPTETTMYEKRSIAVRLPEWKGDLCVQCNLCSFVCPHAAIRPKISDASLIDNKNYTTIAYKDKLATDADRYRIQLYPDDCTGCGVCEDVCPAFEKDENGNKTGLRALNMVHKDDILEESRSSLKMFRDLPLTDSKFIKKTPKGTQFAQPLFQFSGACAGCGETSYIRFVTQMFGTRMLHANATGCTSIFGGTAPTSPCATDKNSGFGPAWANSLFEDNAEFGFGMEMAVSRLYERAFAIRDRLLDTNIAPEIKENLKGLVPIKVQQEDPATIETNQQLVMDMMDQLEEKKTELTDDLKELLRYLPYFIKKSIWIIGGDGWAYDIGYGGVDHILAQDKDVNIMVLDTEVYSNTGGQKSKATPFGAVAKFASGGKRLSKKDLGLMAMAYQHCYVAQINYDANPTQSIKAIVEAERFPGPSILICYSNCIEHGIDMSRTKEAGKAASDSGYWLMYRYDPRLIAEGKNPLMLDSKKRKISYMDFAMKQNRFRRLKRERPDDFQEVMRAAEESVNHRFEFYRMLADMDYTKMADAIHSEANYDVEEKNMSKSADYRP